MTTINEIDDESGGAEYLAERAADELRRRARHVTVESLMAAPGTRIEWRGMEWTTPDAHRTVQVLEALAGYEVKYAGRDLDKAPGTALKFLRTPRQHIAANIAAIIAARP